MNSSPDLLRSRVLVKTLGCAKKLLGPDLRSDNKIAMAYCRYMALWAGAPPLQAIIIGQSPYNEYKIPYIASAFAYEGTEVTPSVHVIANSVSALDTLAPDKAYNNAVTAFKESYKLLEHGVLCINARIISGYLTNDALVEATDQVSCIKYMILRSGLLGVTRINVVCLGIEACGVGHMIRTSVTYKGCPIVVSISQCSHPARIVREMPYDAAVLDKPGVTKVIVSILGKVAPTSSNKRLIMPGGSQRINADQLESIRQSCVRDLETVGAPLGYLARTIKDSQRHSIYQLQVCLGEMDSSSPLYRELETLLEIMRRNEVALGTVVNEVKTVLDGLNLSVQQRFDYMTDGESTGSVASYYTPAAASTSSVPRGTPSRTPKVVRVVSSASSSGSGSMSVPPPPWVTASLKNQSSPVVSTVVPAIVNIASSSTAPVIIASVPPSSAALPLGPAPAGYTAATAPTSLNTRVAAVAVVPGASLRASSSLPAQARPPVAINSVPLAKRVENTTPGTPTRQPPWVKSKHTVGQSSQGSILPAPVVTQFSASPGTIALPAPLSGASCSASVSAPSYHSDRRPPTQPPSRVQASVVMPDSPAYRQSLGPVDRVLHESSRTLGAPQKSRDFRTQDGNRLQYNIAAPSMPSVVDHIDAALQQPGTSCSTEPHPFDSVSNQWPSSVSATAPPSSSSLPSSQLGPGMGRQGDASDMISAILKANSSLLKRMP